MNLRDIAFSRESIFAGHEATLWADVPVVLRNLNDSDLNIILKREPEFKLLKNDTLKQFTTIPKLSDYALAHLALALKMSYVGPGDEPRCLEEYHERQDGVADLYFSKWDNYTSEYDPRRISAVIEVMHALDTHTDVWVAFDYEGSGFHYIASSKMADMLKLYGYTDYDYEFKRYRLIIEKQRVIRKEE